MKNKKISGQRGVTLTALVITVTAILILTSVVLYNAKNDLKLNKLRAMKNDISNLRDKVSSYYAKYGDIPAIKNVAYTNIENLTTSNIIGANDTGNFYVIDLKALENLTLNYGKDYEKIKNISSPTFEQINSLADIYIINVDSQNIFYVQGIEVDGYMYYTDYTEKDVDKEKLELLSFTQGSTILPGHLATENEQYIKNGEAVIPKGFIIVPGCDDVSKGLVISDNANDTELDPNSKISNGNQFVWIPVTDMSKFVRQEGYKNGTFDTKLLNSGEAEATGENGYLKKNSLSESYCTLIEAKAMYQSVKNNKGFYIGRYEAGVEQSRINTTPLSNVIVKKNKPVYNYIAWSNNNIMNIDTGGAVEVARNMYTDKKTYGVTSTLCYGVQWDATLNFIDSNYITNGIIGKPNCTTNSYIVNSTGNGNYSKSLINTGSNDSYAIKNIYDMAGNVVEWTMESYDTYRRVCRGGYYDVSNDNLPSSYRNRNNPDSSRHNIGFRVTLFVNEKIDILPSTADTIPFLPEGAIKVQGTNLDNGLTIKDERGNEWVWIEVPKSIYNNTTYNNNGANKPSNSSEHEKIEAVMHEYTKTYRNKTSNTDTWYSEAQHGFATANEYNNHKNKMLESVYENGGFYIGKYEAGIMEPQKNRTSNNKPIETPVIKEGAYPYNHVTNKQAQQKATELSTGGKTSSLMFGVQWDLVLKHIETKGGKTVQELTQDSSSWGNYLDVPSFNINRGKYSEDYGETFILVPGVYSKNVNNKVLLTTGATERNSVLNIYDLAGNISEWTLEYTFSPYFPCACRGSAYPSNKGVSSERGVATTTNRGHGIGFRPVLY